MFDVEIYLTTRGTPNGKSKIYQDLEIPSDYSWCCSKSEFLFAIKNNLSGPKVCLICDKETKFRSFSFGYQEHCSVECANTTISVRRAETLLKRYGVDNPLANKEFLDKRKYTCSQKYGTEHPAKSEQCKIKAANTCQQRYGVDAPMQNKNIRQKSKATCLNLYGVDNVFKSKEIKQKIVSTNNEKYGADHHFQNSKFFSDFLHTSFPSKEYVLPSGNRITIQGYENFLLDELLERFTEDEITNKPDKMPEFWYKTADNKKHRYYPDFFVPSTNTVYEVKSAWTNKVWLKNNIKDLKQKSVLDVGCNYEIITYSKDGLRIK